MRGSNRHQESTFQHALEMKRLYWAAFYLVDKQGQVVYTDFGEGKYEPTEVAIKQLLAEK
jgi:hypothetical protein